MAKQGFRVTILMGYHFSFAYQFRCVAMYQQFPQNEAEARAKRHSRGVIQRRTCPNSANKDVDHRPPSRTRGKNKKMGACGCSRSVRFSDFN